LKFGLHIPDFTWECGVDTLRGDLADVARVAEQAGFDRISVMDHLWKIGPVGPVEHAMLEAYTTLGYLAAKTERVQLLTVVTAVVYRQPGLLAKAVSTLDVLSRHHCPRVRARDDAGLARDRRTNLRRGLLHGWGIRTTAGDLGLHLRGELPADLDPTTLHLLPEFALAINASMTALDELVQTDKAGAAPCA